jgi:hypothetical protein
MDMEETVAPGGANAQHSAGPEAAGSDQ